MLITTKDNIKLLVGNSGTSDDILLNSIALAVSRYVEKYLGREIETKQRTEYFDVEPGQALFHVKAFPVTACAVYNDTYRAFTTAVPTTNYTYLGEWGQIIVDQYTLESGAKVLKVVYTGGIAASQTALESGDFKDIEMAARIQGAFWFERRKALGLLSENVEGGSLQFQKLELLPTVKEVLEPYCRILNG